MQQKGEAAVAPRHAPRPQRPRPPVRHRRRGRHRAAEPDHQDDHSRRLLPQLLQRQSDRPAGGREDGVAEGAEEHGPNQEPAEQRGRPVPQKAARALQRLLHLHAPALRGHQGKTTRLLLIIILPYVFFSVILLAAYFRLATVY